jgi:hypothetical protein
MTNAAEFATPASLDTKRFFDYHRDWHAAGKHQPNRSAGARLSERRAVAIAIRSVGGTGLYFFNGPTTG